MITSTAQSRAIKAKGREAENAVVAYLKKRFPLVERRRQTGSKDTGDISGIANVVLEVKAESKQRLGEWVGELEAEVTNANAIVGSVIHKRRGTLDVGEWYATLPVKYLARLLESEVIRQAALKGFDDRS